jgi:predicted XRE-type DNA-binding protein
MTKRNTDADADEAMEITRGSGNVFADLGLPNPEDRLAKAELSRVIAHVIKDKKWSQKRAAEALGIAPSDMSNV